eukprot:1157124-Pelagomonas_calceolata.AAC.4
MPRSWYHLSKVLMACLKVTKFKLSQSLLGNMTGAVFVIGDDSSLLASANHPGETALASFGSMTAALCLSSPPASVIHICLASPAASVFLPQQRLPEHNPNHLSSAPADIKPEHAALSTP